MDCKREIGRELWPWDRDQKGDTHGLCDDCDAARDALIVFEDPDPAAHYMEPQREHHRKQRAVRIGRALLGAYLVFGSVTLLYVIAHLVLWAIR